MPETKTAQRKPPKLSSELWSTWEGSENTFAVARQQITEWAKKDFAKHVLTTKRDFFWMCGEPGSSIMRFYVIIEPGVIVVYGDVGEWILRVNESTCEGTLSWIQSATGSPSYLIEKVRAACSDTKEWYAGDAYRWLYDELLDAGNDSALWKVADDLKDHRGVEDRMEWGNLVYDRTGDPDDCSMGMNLSSRSLWLVEVLKTFTRLYTEGQETKTS